MHAEYERSIAAQLIDGRRCDGCDFFRATAIASGMFCPAFEESFFIIFTIFNWRVIIVIIIIAIVARIIDDIVVIAGRQYRQRRLIAKLAVVAGMDARVIGEHEVVGIIFQTVGIITVCAAMLLLLVL